MAQTQTQPKTRPPGTDGLGQCKECKGWFRALDVTGLCEACGFKYWRPDYDRPEREVEE